MAAGSAFGPWGAAAGAAIDMFGGSGGGGSSPAGPSGASSDNVFDSSGWTVATGGSKAGAAGTANPYLIGAGILAVTLLAILWIKKK